MCIDDGYVLASGICRIASDRFAVWHRAVRKYLISSDAQLRLFDDGKHEITFNPVISGDIMITVFDVNEKETYSTWFTADQVRNYVYGGEA